MEIKDTIDGYNNEKMVYNIYKSDEKVNNKMLYNIIKRVFDIVVSLCAMILLLPLFVVIGILIKIDSKGPIFFLHNRIGKNGKKIKIYKFRTMVQNAEELMSRFSPEQKREFDENYKLDNDFRITKIGNILRKTSLDELPQLLNILKGDMSIVGPRPLVKKELEKYGDKKDKFLSVTPGLTGNWACNGRSNIEYPERIKLELDYIDNCSLWLDIKIILKTIISVFKKEGAK